MEPGITRLNALTLFFSGFSLIGFATFGASLHPIILTEILHIPKESQGALIGQLGALTEGVVILTAAFLGSLSEKIGRRIIYLIGLLIVSVSLVIYPFANTAFELLAYRFIYSLGFAAAAVMFHTCVAAYSQDVTRGKWMGLIGFINGIGVMFMAFGLAKLPAWFSSLGFDQVNSIRNALWVMSAYFVLMTIIGRLGLEPKGIAMSRQSESILVLARKGFSAARANPRIALAYGMAFASRGDLAVLTSFFFLWLVQAGQGIGMSSTEANSVAAMYFGLSQLVALFWGLSMGFVLDKVNRTTGMCIAFAAATLGYLSLGLIADPFGPFIIPACIAVGIGEGCAIVAGGVLIGQEAPANIRGAVLGTFSLMGSTGILFIMLLGGFVSDAVGRTAPFILVALVNFSVFVGALIVRFPRASNVATAKPSAKPD